MWLYVKFAFYNNNTVKGSHFILYRLAGFSGGVSSTEPLQAYNKTLFNQEAAHRGGQRPPLAAARLAHMGAYNVPVHL